MSITVCGFGDSILKGVSYDEQRGKYAYLDNSFANKFARQNGYMVDNYAKFGCTIGKGENILNKISDKLSEYKYTILEFGGNDCDFRWDAVSENPEGFHDANTPIEDFVDKYSKIIGKLKEAGSQPILMSLPPLDAERYFSWISKNLSGKNILKWLGDVGQIYRWHERYNLAVVKVGILNKVPLIDIREAFLAHKNYRQLFCLDGIHPNEAGHSLIYQTILDFSVCPYIIEGMKSDNEN